MNPKVNFYFDKPSAWQEEYNLLRELVLSCPLQEELKWGVPCYTFNKKNVVLIHGFKDYCALLFHKGALLGNADGLLIQQTENVQAARQMRFTSAKEIKALSAKIKSHIFEAIEVEKAGLQVELKKTDAFEMVEEFEMALKKNAALNKAFYALTPGRQRAYLLFFAAAKQSKTREARIAKCTPDMLAGKGLND